MLFAVDGIFMRRRWRLYRRVDAKVPSPHSAATRQNIVIESFDRSTQFSGKAFPFGVPQKHRGGPRWEITEIRIRARRAMNQIVNLPGSPLRVEQSLLTVLLRDADVLTDFPNDWLAAVCAHSTSQGTRYECHTSLFSAWYPQAPAMISPHLSCPYECTDGRFRDRSDLLPEAVFLLTGRSRPGADSTLGYNRRVAGGV